MPARPLNFLSGMPQITSAFQGWQQKITLTRRSQTVDGNGLTQYSYSQFSFMGTIQPLSPKLIALKPEGQRAWTWLQIHCFSGDLDLTDNDQIIYSGEAFKVMGVNDYSLNGYVEYHAIEDYQNPVPVVYDVPGDTWDQPGQDFDAGDATNE